jgi:PAS domain-containing protein
VIGVDHYPKLTYDHHRVINKVNDAFCRMTGYTEAELLGQPFAKVSNDGKELFDRQSRLLRVSLEVSQCPVGRDGWCDSLVCVVLPERSRTDLATLGMTPQDLVMIQYLTAGMTVGKAAIKMEVPQRTIEGRILQIRKKLEAKNIAQLIQKLNDLGVLGD